MVVTALDGASVAGVFDTATRGCRNGDSQGGNEDDEFGEHVFKECVRRVGLLAKCSIKVTKTLMNERERGFLNLLYFF